MKNKKTIKIGIGPLKDTAARFIDAWHKTERDASASVLELLTFEDIETFLTVMTSTRWRLLRILHDTGPSSVRALAQHLGRDYKNVHNDVGLLENAGLLSRTKDNRIAVTWDSIVAELDLQAA